MTSRHLTLISLLALAACSRGGGAGSTSADATTTTTPTASSAASASTSASGPRTDMAYDAARPMAGVWSSNQGPMRVSQDGDHVTGTYDLNNGRIDGTLAQGRFTGDWMQTSSGQECPTEHAGTRYWGRAVFTPSADGRTFTGQWSYCDGVLDGDWTGERGRPAE